MPHTHTHTHTSDWGLCGECIRADQRRQAEGGREHRRMMAAVCREVNKQR